MKALIPSHRENKRYLSLKGKNLKKEVPLAIREFIGTLGMSEAVPKFIESNEGSAILSINRKSLEKVRAAFALWTKRIEVLKVSGTLKQLRK